MTSTGTIDVGFPTHLFTAPVDDGLVCLICHCVVEEAAECPCGHLFCGAHIREWLAKSETCPSCREPCKSLKTGNNIHLSYRRLISELTIRCENHVTGCPEVLALKDFRKHRTDCSYTMGVCK